MISICTKICLKKVFKKLLKKLKFRTNREKVSEKRISDDIEGGSLKQFVLKIQQRRLGSPEASV